MLTLLTGKTGSGKSYYAVEEIFKTLENNRKVFTNIKISYEDENYHYMDELSVKKFIEYIETTFHDVENLDDKKEEVKQTIYFDADFYIDEAHLVGFRSKTEAILNWMTLQRHFNQNIIIITQVPTNIHRDYLTMFHNHINMIPQNKRISKSSLGLREYDSYKGERLRTTYFKPKTDIFELYSSGKAETGVNADIFKLYALGGGLLILGIVAYFIISNFFDQEIPINDNNNTKVIAKKKIETEIETISEEAVMCTTDKGCYYNARHYGHNEFILFILSKRKGFSTQVLAKNSSGWKMIKYQMQGVK